MPRWETRRGLFFSAGTLGYRAEQHAINLQTLAEDSVAWHGRHTCCDCRLALAWICPGAKERSRSNESCKTSSQRRRVAKTADQGPISRDTRGRNGNGISQRLLGQSQGRNLCRYHHWPTALQFAG